MPLLLSALRVLTLFLAALGEGIGKTNSMLPSQRGNLPSIIFKQGNYNALDAQPEMQPEHSEVAIDTLPPRHEVSVTSSRKQRCCSSGSVAARRWGWGRERAAEGRTDIWSGVGVLFICRAAVVSQVCTPVRQY